MLNKFFPISSWIKNYSLKTLSSDAFAGITLAAFAIPISLAYAALAGLPPQYGVYGYLIGGVFYAMLGTGKQIAIGPTAAISLVIGSTISAMANGDIHRWADIASLTGLVFGAMSIIAYLLRLSGFISFISQTVLLGFKAGAAITIGLTQLPKLFGVKGGGDHFFERLSLLFQQLPETNLPVFIFGISAIAILIVGEKIFPGKPIAIIVVIISILLISFTSIGNMGFGTVGLLPSGLPELYIPSIKVNDIDEVLPLAFACFLLAYIESVSAAKTFAQKNGYEIDARQELLALGIANMANAFGHGFPVTGGLSQSAVNDEAGAKTPMALVFASASIAFCLLFLTGFMQRLPVVILPAIVLVAIKNLIDFKELNRTRKVDLNAFLIAMIAFISVIILGILKGVLIGAIATLLLLIKSISNPNVAFLGRIPGTKRYSDLKRHADNETISGVLIFRVEAPLLYFNTDNIRKAIWAKILSSPSNLKLVIWDLSSSPEVDMEGAKLIRKVYIDLQERGINLKVTEALSSVRDRLRSEDLEHLLGHISRVVSNDDLVEKFLKESKSA